MAGKDDSNSDDRYNTCARPNSAAAGYRQAGAAPNPADDGRPAVCYPEVCPAYAPLVVCPAVCSPAVFRAYAPLADAKAQAASQQAAAPADARRDVAAFPPQDAARRAHPIQQASRVWTPAAVPAAAPAGDPAPGQQPRRQPPS